MQAVQTIGSMRLQQRRRSKNTIVISVAKKLAVPLLLIITVLLAVFIPTGADSADSVVMSVNAAPQSAQSAAHLAYTTAVMERDTNDGGRTKTPDISEFYVDASDVIPVFNPALKVGTSSGLVVSMNSPTQKPAQGAFVTNIKSIVSLQFEETVQIEKNLGAAGNVDLAGAVDQFLTTTYMFGASYYAKAAYNEGGPLRGAVGPALLDRNYYLEDKWAQMNSSSGMWDSITRGSGRINLMLVKPEDKERYWEGQDVDVYYVEYGVVDAKGHCAPWGLCQTYMPDRASSNAISSWPITGGYGDRDDVVFAEKESTRVGTITALWKKIRETGITQYWLPFVSSSPTELGITSVTTTYGTPIHMGTTANLFESGAGPAYDEFGEMFSGYALVGVLVLTNS